MRLPFDFFLDTSRQLVVPETSVRLAEAQPGAR